MKRIYQQKKPLKSGQREISQLESTYRSSKVLKLFSEVLSYMKTLKHTSEQSNLHMKSKNGLYLVKLSYNTSYTISDHIYQVWTTSVINSMNTKSSFNAWTQQTFRWGMIVKLFFTWQLPDCDSLHTTNLSRTISWS